MNSSVSPIPDVHDLTLDQRLGQMLMLGFRGTRLDEDNPIVTDLRDDRIGGVILFNYDTVLNSFERNIASPDQVTRLTADLMSRAEIPLITAVDQEGGTVNRLSPDYGFPVTKSHKDLGEINDLALTYKYAQEIAVLLRSTGHNMNFAPCVDLAINKENKAIYGRDRCFSDDPEVAALHASAYIRAHRQAGILTTLKHFPGHGSSKADTHFGMVDVTDTWQEFETLPYLRILDEGLCDTIMTTHIVNRKLDPDWPATLSTMILTGILRGHMGFDGVIISDDLQMKAISEHYGQDAVMQRALLAGVDILLYGNNMDFEPGVSGRFQRVAKEMLDRGEISEERINASAERILGLKKQIQGRGTV